MSEGQLRFISPVEAENKKEFEEFLLQQEVLMLRKDFLIIETMLLEISGEMPGWNRFKDQPKTKIYYKQEDGLNQITMYVEQEIEAPLINLAALLSEVQLFKNWIPMIKQSDLVGEVSHLRKLAYFRANLPWPFEQRECFIQACGVILKEENAAVLSMSSV